MHTPLIPTAAAMFLLLAAVVALALVWDGDAERAKRAAKRDAKAEREMRDELHAQVDVVIDHEEDTWLEEAEDRRAEWHQVIDDLSIAVLPGGNWSSTATWNEGVPTADDHVRLDGSTL